MPRITIKEAITQVLEKRKTALTPMEIFDEILNSKCYDFKSKNALAVVSTELRRHSQGSVQSKNKSILFLKSKDGKYTLI